MATVIQITAHIRTKYGVALILTFAAGCVDVVGFVSVYRLFTAHMTGTTVHLAEYLVHRKWDASLTAAIVVGSFLAGSIFGRVLIEIGARADFRRIASTALAIEAALLACVFPAYFFVGSGTSSICVALILLASAMGMQTATLTRIGPLTIHTTFVTGMLNRLAELVSRLVFCKRDLRRATNSDEALLLRQKLVKEVREVYFILGIWFLYLAGAASGTALVGQWHLKSLYLPCCLLLIAIAADQVRPLSIEEEKQQLQS